MKNVIKYILILIVGGLVVSSCDNLPTNYDDMTNDYDKNNTTYYIQLLGAINSFETAIDDAGNPVNIETTISVGLMGAPQSSDITVNLVENSETTIGSDMYIMESTSLTIPAGQSSASMSLTCIADKMPVGETVKLVLDLDAGGKENAVGAQLAYTLKRVKFCPWAVDDMVGAYTGSDYNGYAASGSEGLPFSVAKVDDTHIAVSGIGQHLYSVVWGEVVSAGDAVVMEVKPNGILVFENQFLCQTDGVWDYYMGPSDAEAKWDGCEFTMTIPWIWHWDDAYADAYACNSNIKKN